MLLQEKNHVLERFYEFGSSLGNVLILAKYELIELKGLCSNEFF